MGGEGLVSVRQQMNAPKCIPQTVRWVISVCLDVPQSSDFRGVLALKLDKVIVI